MDGDILENAPRLDADIFKRIKKMRFKKYPDTCGRGPIFPLAALIFKMIRNLVSLFTAPSEPVTITDVEPGSDSFVVTWRVSAIFIINFFKSTLLK